MIAALNREYSESLGYTDEIKALEINLWHNTFLFMVDSVQQH